MVGARQRCNFNSIAARDIHERIAGPDDVNVAAGGASWRCWRPPFASRRNVARNDETLPRPDLAGVTDAVCLQNCRRRHAVPARYALDRLAVADRHGRAAVPGPMTW